MLTSLLRSRVFPQSPALLPYTRLVYTRPRGVAQFAHMGSLQVAASCGVFAAASVDAPLASTVGRAGGEASVAVVVATPPDSASGADGGGSPLQPPRLYRSRFDSAPGAALLRRREALRAARRAGLSDWFPSLAQFPTCGKVTRRRDTVVASKVFWFSFYYLFDSG